ncbi:MAG TPA: ATP-binding cassette domain-containing protein [Thermoanaerobaculia bacterium]|nr:ATP-binding cassette domain-containing protein [Thermoanaerobaculia bacterium]
MSGLEELPRDRRWHQRLTGPPWQLRPGVSRRGRRLLLPLLLAAVLAAAELAAPDSFLTDLLGTACIAGIMVLSWTVFCGPTREISFGHAFFIGSAGYLAGFLQARSSWNPWSALLAGVGCGLLLGAFVALFTARHRGLYFSMVTMALQLTLYRALFLRSDLLGGEEGIVGVRSLAATRTGIYATVAAALVAACIVVDAFLCSRTGLLLGATGENEQLARSLGVRVALLRLRGLTLAGALAGLGGGLYVLTQGQANAELASEEISIRTLLLGTIGGLWSVPGALLSVFALQGVQAALFRLTRQDALAYTGLLLGLVLLLPRGLLPLRPRWPRQRSCPRPTTLGPDHDAPGLMLSDLGVRFGGVKALDGVSLEVVRGESIGLIGPNGAGKTTLLSVIAGVRRAEIGEVRWGGRALGAMDEAQRARLGIRKTHQQVVYFPQLTLDEHLAVAQACWQGGEFEVDAAALQRLAACDGAAGEAAPLERLPPSRARLAEIAMALAAPPELLLLDEPFAALDREEVEAVCEAIQALQRRGVTMVIVEHRLRELFRLVERVVVMDHGRIISRQPAAQVLDDPVVREAYGLREREGNAG